MDANCRQLLKITTSLFVLLFLFSQSFTLSAKESSFNHDKTGFELVGPHERISCDSCHIRGIFKGIPKQCEACHDRGSQIATSLKPANHLITSGSCEGCHAGNTWAVTGFDHDSIIGSCISCHNGTTTTGKPANHVQSTNTCDDCHSQVSWVPARFDHSAIIGSCVSCHNGVTATGKTPTHINSSNSCDNCHITATWTTNRVDHNDVVGGSCFTCHNGVTATGKHPNHITSGTICDDCHSTSAWTPAGFDHDSAGGICSSCHNGNVARGPSPTHFQTSLQCDNCHTNKYWTPDIYSHAGTDYPGDHASDPTCVKCHKTNNSSINWNTTYSPNCAACHAGDFKADAHKKDERTDPVTLYTVDDLQSCATTCHLTKSDGSVVTRTGQHSVNQGGW